MRYEALPSVPVSECAHLFFQGKTGFDVAMEAQNKFAMDTLAMGRSKASPQGVCELLTRQPVSAVWSVCGGGG